MECGGESCGYRSCASANNRPPVPSSSRKTCCKCKESPAQIAANQTEFLCSACLHTSLFSKFKTAITVHELIQPSHRVLLAFSGGPASRVLLEFILEIREKAKKESLYCNDGRGKVFGFGVVHLDESSIFPSLAYERDGEVINEEIRKIAFEGEKKPDELLCVPLENAYYNYEIKLSEKNDSDSVSRKERLQMLLRSVSDPTGKEDILQQVRMQALQQVAKFHGYTRLVLGLSTTRIAAKVLSATAKGHGFSLPAEMQFFDARWNVPVVLPLRDCVLKELVLLCHFKRFHHVFIPTLSTLSNHQSSINTLSANFVSVLQEENPARERTIVRTAAKLQPFSFNYLSSGSPVLNLSDFSDGNIECLCPLCCLPLNPKEFIRRQGHQESMEVSSFIQSCCTNCQLQIFGESNATYDLLPQITKSSELINSKIKDAWIRAQISDCLISDSDSD